jgi:hypothetical protein
MTAHHLLWPVEWVWAGLARRAWRTWRSPGRESTEGAVVEVHAAGRQVAVFVADLAAQAAVRRLGRGGLGALCPAGVQVGLLPRAGRSVRFGFRGRRCLSGLVAAAPLPAG